MFNNKRLSIFLLIFFQFYDLKVLGDSKKIVKNTDSEKTFEKIYFPTTNIKGDLFFTLGALLQSNSSEALHFTYENKFKINTSFKGTDKLLTIIESGNASNSPLNLDLQSKKGDNL